MVQRYNALLQMYGEKEEQVQELKLDLADMKDMYRTQVRTSSTVHVLSDIMQRFFTFFGSNLLHFLTIYTTTSG